VIDVHHRRTFTQFSEVAESHASMVAVTVFVATAALP